MAKRLTRALISGSLGLLLIGTAAAQSRAPVPDPLLGDGRTSPFYTWAGVIPVKPGTLLRQEPLPATLGLAGAAAQYRILYASTDGVDGKTPVVVSGAVFVPKGQAPAGGWPVVAWGHGTIGVADVCAPSWQGRSYRDLKYLNRWLAEGFAVVASDYQGIGVPGGNPALNNRANSYSILDSVRAAFKTVPGLANKIVLVGQSQGGSAVVAAAGYAPRYAPDLGIRGTIATGTIYTPEGYAARAGAPLDATRVDPTIAYTFYSVHSARQRDPSLRADEIFTPRALPIAEQGRVSCLFQNEQDVVDEGLTQADAFKPGHSARLAKWWDEYVSYPTLKLDHPIFIGAGRDDGLAEGNRRLIRDLQRAGTVVWGKLYERQGHSGTVNTSLEDSVPFAKRAIAGEPIAGRYDDVAP